MKPKVPSDPATVPGLQDSRLVAPEKAQWISAGNKDLPILVQCYQELMADESGNRHTFVSMQDAERKALTRTHRIRMQQWLDSPKTEVKLFVLETQVLAYLLYDLQHSNGNSVFLRHFFVVRTHRRQGVGRRAIAALLKELASTSKHIYLDVISGNSEGQSFWTHMGFTRHSVRMERDV